MAAGILPIINTISSLSGNIIPKIAPPAMGGGQNPFAAAFADAVSSVEAFQANAGSSVGRFLNGEGEELHRVALESEKAQLSFDLFLQARNKIVSAYQEIMRMQVRGQCNCAHVPGVSVELRPENNLKPRDDYSLWENTSATVKP